MDVYVTEEEQIEKIKQLWNRYGNSLMTVILIVALAITGYRWWQQRELSISTQASDIYFQLLSNDLTQNESGLQAMANTLLKTYPSTPYASQAAFILARVAASKGEMGVAIDQLKWVLTHTPNRSFKQIAKLRYANILLAQNKSQEALTELAVIDDPTFKPLIENLRGDIYRNQMQMDKARTAYEEALGLLPKETLTSAIVQMKLDNLVGPRGTKRGVNA